MSVIDWLLEGDPAIRWQVLRDLTDASPDEVAAERARVEHEGWGARLLALEGADGLWDGGACFPAGYTGGEPGQPWTATMHTLQTLQILGLDPASEAARRAIALVAEHGRWEHAGQRYFDGEVEPCINGRTIETGAYFGVDVAPIVDADPRRAARRRRLELRGRERVGALLVRHDDQRARRAARVRARDRRLRRGARGAPRAGRSTCSSAACSVARAPARSSIRRISTSPSRTTGTTTCCARSTTSGGAGADPDPRMAEAVEVVRSKRSPTAGGCSTASIRVASTSTSRTASGQPSRWNTLRALRVLDWWEG